jgi:lysophospholipase
VEIPGAYHDLLQETDEVRAAFWREFDALADQVAPETPLPLAG